MGALPVLVQMPHKPCKSTLLGPVQDLYTQDDTVKHVSHIYSFVSTECLGWPYTWDCWWYQGWLWLVEKAWYASILLHFHILILFCFRLNANLCAPMLLFKIWMPNCATMYVSTTIWTLCISLCVKHCLIYPKKAIISSRTSPWISKLHTCFMDDIRAVGHVM